MDMSQDFRAATITMHRILFPASRLYTGMGMSIGPITSTKKFCEGASDTETTYLQILQNARTYTVNGNGLTITNNLNSMLVYQR